MPDLTEEQRRALRKRADQLVNEINRQGRALKDTQDQYRSQYAKLVELEQERTRILLELGDMNHA